MACLWSVTVQPECQGSTPAENVGRMTRSSECKDISARQKKKKRSVKSRAKKIFFSPLHWCLWKKGPWGSSDHRGIYLSNCQSAMSIEPLWGENNKRSSNKSWQSGRPNKVFWQQTQKRQKEHCFSQHVMQLWNSLSPHLVNAKLLMGSWGN